MISAVVLTKDEEKNIKDCLESLKFCDQILVVDDNSSDNTQKVAKRLGAKVFIRLLNDDYAPQRNFGLKKASYDWVLFVDADERISNSLKKEIIQAVKSSEYNGYLLKRRDMMWGKWLKSGETGTIELLRLGKKDAGKWRRRVHEYWDIRGNIGRLNNSIIHFPHPTIREFILSINRRSTIHAQENKKEGKRSNLFKIIIWPIGHFIKNYFLKKGYQDGLYGFVFALIMSFHSFLGWSKLWLIQKKG